MSALRHAFQQSDLVERHTVVARLLAEHLPGEGATVLDVGGRAGLLAEYTRRRVTAINPDGTGDLRLEGSDLPFAGGAFDAVVTIDTLEHVPPVQRQPFVQACGRVARQLLIVAAPFGSEAHVRRERELDELHRSVYGHYHPYLHEHVVHGLPTPTQLATLAASIPHRRRQLFYAGDFTWQARMFEQSVRAAGRSPLLAHLLHLVNRLGSAALLHPVRLATEPGESANRFYLVLEK